jgi:glycosyltransferase involved in cell wall biosynthesis
VVDAARLLEDDSDGKDILILMLGDVSNRKALIDQAQGLDNILLLEQVSRAEVIRYWSILDLAIIHLKKSDLFKTVIPSKMFECMAMGIPILHGVEGESADIIEKYKVGKLFEPQNATELVERIKALKKDSNERMRISKNGIQSAAHFDRVVLANCSIPDDRIDPRRCAFFMARSVLGDIWEEHNARFTA